MNAAMMQQLPSKTMVKIAVDPVIGGFSLKREAFEHEKMDKPMTDLTATTQWTQILFRCMKSLIYNFGVGILQCVNVL